MLLDHEEEGVDLRDSDVEVAELTDRQGYLALSEFIASTTATQDRSSQSN